MEIYRRSLLAFAALVLLLTLIFLGRLFSLQLIHGKKYAQISERTTLRQIRLPAPRGRILDRNGVILADNRPSFRLVLHRSQSKNLPQTLRTLAYLLELPESVIEHRLKSQDPLASLLFPQVIERDLSVSARARIAARMTEIEIVTPVIEEFPSSVIASEAKQSRRATGLPRRAAAGPPRNDSFFDLSGIDIIIHYERHYPLGEAAGHLLGYVREAGRSELEAWEAKEPGRVGPGDDVGIKGIEKKFDESLRGYDGFQGKLVDATGREVDVSQLGLSGLLQAQAAIPGADLQLTVDARLLQTASEALGARPGAVVALDPQNGEVLALVSTPSYHPEALTGTIDPDTWRKLSENPQHVFINRSLQAAYPPGSTHKIVTSVAALAEHKTKVGEKIYCPGYYDAGSRRWGCWNKRGHGWVDLHDALKGSCDVYFYHLGERLGPDKLAHYARLLGLGRKTSVLADSERDGLIPNSAWKERHKHEAWTMSDNYGNAIGQGYNLVTPMQNALMVAQFANGGKKIIPHLDLLPSSSFPESENTPFLSPLPLRERARERGNSALTTPLNWNLSQSDYQYLLQALIDVVNAPGGTGARAKLPQIKVAGKTGTAQVIALGRRGQAAKGVNTEDHAWFVAFAPADQPQIALAVLLENGGGGGAMAAPIAKKVLETYFAKQTP